MSQLRQSLIVAGWEFARYFKWRDQVIGLICFLVLGGISYGVGRFATASGRTLTVAVEGLDVAMLEPAVAGGRLRFVQAPPVGERAKALSDGTLHGILARRPDGGFDLLVERDPRYLPRLTAALDHAVRRERLTAHGLTPSSLQQILTPAEINVVFTDPARGAVGRAEQFLAGICTAIVMFAVFMGMAYQLTGITGEKQLRVTESIVSIVPAQAWIDGKILGITAYSLVNVANMAVGLLFVALTAKLAWGFELPEATARPTILLMLLVFCTLALLLWNAFFAAFAATIDDPNTSARTSLMFVPILFVGAGCWIVLRDPDSTVARIFALFPLTSAPALPVRAILSDVGLLETLVALVLLVATTWLMRRTAGRIFEVGMLIYGQEPTLREIARWARQA